MCEPRSSGASPAGDPELGARLASSLDRFWSVRGHLIEERRWLERALATNPSRPRGSRRSCSKGGGDRARPRRPWSEGENEQTNAWRRPASTATNPRSRDADNLGLIASGERDNRQGYVALSGNRSC